MALQVWLPLQGDLKNQGLTNITLNSGSPTYTNGKLGQCLNTGTLLFTAEDDLIVSLGETNIYSICCWCKNLSTSASSRWVFYIGGDATGLMRGLWESNSTTARHWAYSGSGVNITTNINTIDGQWHHLCFTSNGATVKLYVDGIYQSQITNGKTDALTTNHIYLNASDYNLNDFRIYDHVLSQMEVKELSKGLVLHYPLNRGGWGQENLLLNTGTPATWSKALNDSEYAVNDCFKTQTPVPSLFSVDELITISFDWSTTATGGNFHVECGAVTPWVWGTVVSSKGTRNSASNYIDISSTNQSGHVEIIFKITSSQTGAADTLQWLRIRQDGTDTANKTFTISKAKLERGSIATPWCPNSSDTLATTMGLNETTEYDCSGFCNNGTRTGTFSWTSDTPKYSVSQYFEDYTRYISCLMGDSWIPDTITMSCWIKGTNKSARGGFHIPLNMHSTNFEISITSSSGKARMGYMIGGTRYVSDIGSDILDGKWHMLTSTFNGSTICRYIDGVLVNSENRSGVLTAAQTLGVGAFPGGTTYGNTQLYESDVRIYATALSADDVKSLYQNSAYIDSFGNVYGAIHEEG